MVVWRRNLDERDIEREIVPGKECRNIGKEDRRVVGPAIIDRLPHVRADKQGVVPNVTFEPGRDMRRRPFGVNRYRLDIAQIRCAADKRLHKLDRRHCRFVQVNPIAGSYMIHCLIGGYYGNHSGTCRRLIRHSVRRPRVDSATVAQSRRAIRPGSHPAVLRQLPPAPPVSAFRP